MLVEAVLIGGLLVLVLAAFTGYWAWRRARRMPRIPHLEEGGSGPAG